MGLDRSLHDLPILCRAIHVGLEVSAGTKAVLYLSYVVTRASWSSAYDVRVFTKDEAMKVCALFHLMQLVSAPPPFILHYPTMHAFSINPSPFHGASASPSPFHAVQVQYYSLIKQSTGEDWENAKISLSTAQPAIGGGAPTLPTKIIRFKRANISVPVKKRGM